MNVDQNYVIVSNLGKTESAVWMLDLATYQHTDIF